LVVVIAVIDATLVVVSTCLASFIGIPTVVFAIVSGIIVSWGFSLVVGTEMKVITKEWSAVPRGQVGHVKVISRAPNNARKPRIIRVSQVKTITAIRVNRGGGVVIRGSIARLEGAQALIDNEDLVLSFVLTELGTLVLEPNLDAFGGEAQLARQSRAGFAIRKHVLLKNTLQNRELVFVCSLAYSCHSY